MGTNVAHLLALFLMLEGIVVTRCARCNSFGSNPMGGCKPSQESFALKAILAGCDFDDPERPFCDWTQPHDDGGEWLREQGGKPGQSPGPPGGTPERREYYIYPEASESVQLQSPGLDPPASEICVEFLYYLYSFSPEAQLAVNIQDSSGNVSTLWTREGMQSSAWLLGSVTAQIPVQRPFKVVFVATRAETKDIDMALDTISLRLSPCSPCVTGCDFDRLDDLCGWENPAEGDVQWEQWTGPGDEDGVGPEDDFSRPGFGFYMLLDSLDPNGDGAALLKSPTYHSPGGCLALSFHYTLHGVSNSTALNVYAAAVPGGELGSPLLTLRGEHGPDWNLGAINYTGTATVQFVLEGIYRGKPGLAVDSVRISPCEEIFAQCDFNDNANPFCGWVSSGAGKHTWTRTNQSTPTEETGPPGDYPHGEGYYIYAEGGSLQPGQSVVLSSRPFCAETDACVEFFYHMSGIVEVDTQLRVLLEGPSGATTLLWTRTGIQSPGWLLGSVTAPYGGPQPSRVLFEVIRGSNPYLDVALDNLSVRRGPCAATGTPAPPATSAVATLTQAGPAGTVPPAPPTTCLPTSTSRTTQATPAAATPQGSTVSQPQTTAFRSTAGGATGSTLGASSTSTRPEVPHGSSPATTVTLATSPTIKTTATGHFGSSSAGPASSSRTTTGHPGSTHTTRHNSPGATSISTTPVRTTGSPSISVGPTYPPSPGHPSGSSPGATVGPTSHATNPISQPLTAASSRATTLSSHSTVSTSQTMTTGGHSSTGHTSAVKTTPSSVVASTLTTTTTTSIAPPAVSTTMTTTNVPPSTVSSAASPATNTTATTTSSISTARTQPPSTGPTTPSHASSSSPGATVGPTSHATAPISRPLTATSSRATTLSSHSTLDTSQTSATGGHSSTGHTSAVKTTPSSVAASTLTLSTATTTSIAPPALSTATTTTNVQPSTVSSAASLATNTTTATTTSISTARTQPPSTGPTTPSHASSQPLTAASSRATTLSSHSTVSTSQTSATGGHSSTGHTSAIKTTPSSVAASTLTTSSSSSQPSNVSTMSATTGHASTVTSHAAFPTTVSSLTSLNTHQATTTHRSPSTGHTSAHQTASSQVTRGTTPSISSHATSTGAVGHTSRATTAGDSRLTTTTTTTAISLGPNTTSSASSTSQAGHGTSSATTSLANYTTTPSTPATGPNTEPASKPANSSAIPSGPSHVGTTSGTTAQAKPTTAGPTSPLASSQKATTLTTPGHSEPPHSSTTSSTHGGPTSPYATSTTGHGQPFSTSSPPPNYSSSHPATISHAILTTSPTATVGHVNATSTSRGTPAATRPVSTAPASTHSSPTTSGLTNTDSSHASVTTSTASHADTTHSTPHAVPGTTLPATNHTAGASSPTTITKITSPGTTTTGLVVTTTPGAEPRTTTTKLPPTPEASTRSATTSTAPVAPPEQEICTISGDPHYTTYDGRLFHFMGTCTYLLSAVCNATSGLPLFQVQATNEHRGANTQVSYVKSVRVEVYGVQIVLLKGRRVTVDGQRVTLPVSVAEGKVSVRLSGTFALVQTDFGLWVRFDGNHHVEVSAPSSYIGQLCGLCGNYNGQGADDNLMPDGTSAGTDADRLGESWQVPNAEDSPGCTNAGNPGECDQDIKTEAEKPASCGILTDPNGPFAPCHSKVPPDGAFENCVYDLCGTGGDASILCFALQSYADRCAQAGVPIAWRNSSFCPLNCPTGSSYSPCGPACPATCTGSSTSCPDMPCVEGCVCDEGMVLSGDQCVPLTQCGCTDPQGQYHPVGENWMGNEDCSRRCTCGPLNNITCEEWSCSPVQECRRVDGLLGCQDMGVAACHVAGDPHYYTFDGTMVSFMGTCTYTLVTVCDDDPHLPSFNITGKNEERGQPDESYLRQVTVEVAGHTITLQKARRVLIDGLRVRTPVEGRVPGVSITTSGIYVFLETDFGLVVKFDGNHHLEIQLPGTYFEKVCGMCGNFNNESLDDLLMPNGHLATNASQFGNSWKAPGDQDPGCQPDDREDLEPHCSSEEKDRLHALCREILQPKYQACHNIINPQLFIQNCLYDMCEYQGMASVLCDNIQSYVEACKSQGVTGISWRNSTFCPLPCPSHSRYTECASPCPATCSNLYAPASCQRSTTCVEGCTCEPGYVLSDNNCVAMRDCGCVDSQQDYYSPGDTWVTSNCRERCTCAGNGNITCQDFQCLSGSFCTLSSAGLRYCRPTQFHQCVISGDPHYRTFDHFVHHFQGRSTYTLTQTLGSLPEALIPLSVAGRNRRRLPFQRFSFLREVYVSVYGYQITLMQGRHMAVNGLRITPPYHAPDDRLQITQRGRKLIVQTDFGFSVSFDGQDLAEIVLPTTYQDHVGGLCGNYDGRRSNEYMKPDGTWTRSLNTFGNSWQVSVQREVAASGHVRARREEEPTEEAESGFEVDCSPEQLMLVNGTDNCGALSDPQGPFAACHSIISPDTFQESCVYDLCALFNDTELLCQDYNAYAQLCQEEGVTLGPWRQATGCEISCPAHSTYQSCMSACPASCANMAAPSDCQAPCVEGCASDPGYLLSGLEVVPYNQCGCTSNDQYYQINDTFLTDNCSQRCTCRNTGTLECEAAGCPEGQICTVANYIRGCFRASPCLSSPCQNEGTCVESDGPEGFTCSCLESYTGPLCEEAPLDVSPTTAPNATLVPLAPEKEDNHLVAILTGIFVPLGVILIVVMTVCFCRRRRNRMKKEEDRLDVLSSAVQPSTSDAVRDKITQF